MKIEHDSYCHDQVHTSKLVGLGCGLGAIGVRQMIGLKHGSRDGLIPTMSQTTHDTEPDLYWTHIQLTLSQ